MKKNNEEKKLFCKGGGDLAPLYLDMVFVEYVRPVLFTCMNKKGELYLCTCCYADGQKVEWLAAQTTEKDLINLLENRATIRSLFPTGSGEMYLLSNCSVRGDAFQLRDVM